LILFVIAASAYLGVAPRGILAAPPAATKDGAANRSQILASPAWREAMEGFNEWLSAQQIYPRSEIPRVRSQALDQINKMSVGQLQFFLQDMQQKLTLINSQAAYKAQANILYNLNVASDAYAAKLRTQLPNLVTMTAEQVKQALVDLQQQEDNTRADEAAFQKSNAQEVALIQAQNEQTAAANAAADSAGLGNYGGSPYAPRNPMPAYTPTPIITGFGGWPW
jgi:hypothetical protein